MRPPGVLALALPLLGCGMPDTPGPDEAKADGIERASYAVPGAATRVSYLRAGDPGDRRVILVHGTPGSADGWARFLARPPAGVELVAIDRPGFGATTPSNAVPSLAAQAAAIAPLLVEHDGRWPILVGHSLGAPVAAQVALDNPGRVGGLVLLAGSFDPALEHVYAVQRMGEWPGIRSALPRSLRNANVELMALKPQLEALAPRLARLRCRVAVVHGTEDRQVPYANVAFLRTRLAAARLTVRSLKGVNHFLPWNSQEIVEETIASLLAEEPGRC
ncbi:alpha/beta fold hydrolase [Sphingomonas jejuensis]|uniref:Pimeloyl-ACP methyl ester carboxylesterase n=1 Tax=Sphingomonas jejuensis TaxID=904715 RepID=A0ABX0XR88_9SPHN|nr:pimeloyl-ACP methyl ester carboxylesterase [Sphingomonas jejuensis]